MKYEKLFAHSTRTTKQLNRLNGEREKIIEVGLKLGMRRSHIEMISSEEEGDESSSLDELEDEHEEQNQPWDGNRNDNPQQERRSSNGMKLSWRDQDEEDDFYHLTDL
jgi:hypothetical protein